VPTNLAIPPTNRLTYDDDLFLRAGRLLGIPVVNQSVWRFNEPLRRDAVDDLARALAVGRLGRLVVRSGIPAARDRWVPAPAVTPVVHSAPVQPAEILDWAEEQADVDLDPELGPPWQLAYADTTHGGSVLSLVVSHAVGDGGAHVSSIVEAARGTSPGRLPIDGPVQTRLRDDLQDAVGQISRAARGVRQALRARDNTSVPQGTQASTVRNGGQSSSDAPYHPPLVVVEWDARAWDAVAAERGGSANALLIAVAVEILLEVGRVRADAPVKVSLPVSARGESDLRANATTGVSIAVRPDTDGRVTDFDTIRSSSREAFATVGTPGNAPAVRALEPLVQLLPDFLVAKLARNSPVPLCLCSNLGALPEDFTTPVGIPATSVMMRSMTRFVTRPMLRARGGGISTWLARTGDTGTLAVLGLDPDCFPDETVLHGLTSKVLDGWGISTTPW
jgi:hypothetical protein